jgi:5'-nucleotidase
MPGPLILLTNDDAFHAEGLRDLAAAMHALGRVVVVAPDRDRSAASHALSLDHPLRPRRHAEDRWAVDGTPTDCVNLGVLGLLDARPALVVSGINAGLNVGDDVTYSGTIAAAIEGIVLGVPSIAVSQDGPPFDFERGAKVAVAIAETVLEKGLPQDTLLSINVPRGAHKGMKLTTQGRRVQHEPIVKRVDPRGKTYYWIGGKPSGWRDDPRCDHAAVDEGYVSITPLSIDLTNHRALDGDLSAWESVLK